MEEDIDYSPDQESTEQILARMDARHESMRDQLVSIADTLKFFSVIALLLGTAAVLIFAVQVFIFRR